MGALAHLGIPRSTLFRAVARFRRTRRASSLLPLKRGTRDGSSLLDPRIERIIEEQIERFWLKKEKPRFSALMERVHDACHVEGLRAPHRKTIKRRVVDLNPLAAARRRGQGGLEAASTQAQASLSPTVLILLSHVFADLWRLWICHFADSAWADGEWRGQWSLWRNRVKRVLLIMSTP